MAASSHERRAAIAPFRARATRLGLQISWLLLAAVAISAVREDVLSEPRIWMSLAAVAITTLGLSLVKWEDALAHRRGDVLLTLWAVLVVVSLALLSTVEEMSGVALLLSFVVVIFSAVLADPRWHAVITLFAAGIHVVGPMVYGSSRSFDELILPLLTLLLVAMLAGLFMAELRREAERRLDQLAELARREAAFERLYEVTKTMGAGSSLEGVLPELVGKIGHYLQAQVGLVVLHDPVRSALDVVSPIWTAGYSLDIEGYTLPTNGRGEIERVFRTGAPEIYREVDAGPDSILGELGVRSAMCVPLRMDDRTIGVLVLADKEDGEFSNLDLETLVSLSGPAALVLAQLERIEEAAQSSRRMEDLALMKTDFVSVVSHELRTPLTSIIGSLATLSRPELAPDKPQARELVDAAQAQADRLRRLIEDLLMVSRIEHHSLPHNPERISLHEFLTRTVGSIPAPDRSVTVSVSSGAEWVRADPDHLSRIVINLVDNALKYAPSSPVEVSVDLGEDGRIRIAVIDHGSGIQMADRDRAFERFMQLEPSQTRSQGGAGLGLSIVRGLAQSMGGSLELAETPGGGATFVVSIPRLPGSYEMSDPAPIATSP